MNYNLIKYTDLDKNDWDSYVKRMPDAGFHHTWSWINYTSQFLSLRENFSFVYLDDDKSLLAICPLGVSYNDSGCYFEISFGGNPCATPLVSDVSPSVRRKILDKVFLRIGSVAQQFNVRKINMIWDPLVKHVCAASTFHKNNFELLRYQMQYYIENVIVISLNLPEENLFESVSKYQRRHIKKTKKMGVVVDVFNLNNNFSRIRQYFDLFQGAHLKSAGRITRPQQTWDAMYHCLSSGEATLFIAFVEDIPISYLFCGEFDLMAMGWSQVNVDEYESEYSPRHYLEWSAMMFYKTQKFKYYEVGDRYYGSQFFHSPTEKEISISVFKERFGGMLLPKIRWTGYFELELLKADYAIGMQEFVSKVPVIQMPEN